LPVILSGVVGREAGDNAVESLPLSEAEGDPLHVGADGGVAGSSPGGRELWWKLLSEFVALLAGMGSFDCAAASHLRSSRFALDDRAEVVSSKRSSTSTLLEPVAWSCFWILASKDASRISMVMVRFLRFGVRERVG
jgi:hypothetical protein